MGAPIGVFAKSLHRPVVVEPFDSEVAWIGHDADAYQLAVLIADLVAERPLGRRVLELGWRWIPIELDVPREQAKVGAFEGETDGHVELFEL